MTAGQAAGATTPWVKAQASSSGDDCVELRRHGGAVEVRDSKHPHGPVLRFSTSQFAAWLHAAAHGEFADPTDGRPDG